MKQYYVYIMASESRVLYTGITSDLVKRVYEHKEGLADGFTKKYNVKHLVYYEATSDVESAIAQEKQIKGWNRSKREFLINQHNPQWADLYFGLL